MTKNHGLHRPDGQSAGNVIEETLPRSRREWRKLRIVEGRLGKSLRRFLSQPRYLALGVLAAVVIWRPWFVPVFAMCIWLFTLLVAIFLGTERLAKIAGWLFKRYEMRNPDGAKRFHLKVDRFLGNLGPLRDFLPVEWVRSAQLSDYTNDYFPVDEDYLDDRLKRIASDGQGGPE